MARYNYSIRFNLCGERRIVDDVNTIDWASG